jgi:tyrosyl-tRNA synthetase
MGKTAKGAVWLNAGAVLSAYDFWQYWRNTEDADVGRFLKLYTTLPMDEIARLEALAARRSTRPRRILATEVTAMLHGRVGRRGSSRNRAQDLRGRRDLGQPADHRGPASELEGRHRHAGAVRPRRPRRLERRDAPSREGRRGRVNDDRSPTSA